MREDNAGAGAGFAPPTTDVLPIAVRTYGVPGGNKKEQWEFPSRGPSPWQLIFDTETTADEVQRLRNRRVSAALP